MDTNAIKTFIITLSGVEHRAQCLVPILDRLNLSYEFFYGVDARQGVPREHESLLNRRQMKNLLGRELSSGEIGCALSHFLLQKKIVEENIRHALIFEDDAIMSEGDKLLELLESEALKNYDFLQLSYGPARIWRLGFGGTQVTRRIRTERLVHNAGLATAYCVSHRGASFLVQKSIPLRCTADWPIDLAPIKPRIVIPKLVGQWPDGTNSVLHLDRLKAKKMAHVSRVRRRKGENARNPKPRGYAVFHRFLSKTVF